MIKYKDTYIAYLKYFLLFAMLLLFVTISFSQKEGNVWYFGEGVGIDFNTNPPTALNNGSIDVEEGCSSIADENGNLLMYTNGIDLYGKNHLAMPNGSGLLGHRSSTQSAIIVPKPGSDDIYYVFTTSAVPGNGLHYSEVDMTLNGGIGDITATKNVQLIADGTEKLTAVRNENCTGIWVITHIRLSDEFHAYQVTASGVNHTPVVSNTGSMLGGNSFFGCLKASHDGNYLVDARPNPSGTPREGAVLFNFDNSTGQVSNPIILRNTHCYGAEFSPSNQFVYLTSGFDIFQYDLTAADIQGSEILVGRTSSFPMRSITLTSMELGPDNKIYINNSNPTTLDVINDPDLTAPACNLVNNDFSLGVSVESYYGLPQTVLPVIISTTDPTITSTGPFCSNDNVTNLTAVDTGGIWTGNGITDGILGTFDPSLAGAGTHQIIYTIQGTTCPNADTINLVVDPSHNASFNYPFAAYCPTDPDPTPTIIGTLGGTFTIDNGGTINPASGTIDIAASGLGNYIVTYITPTTPGICPDTTSISILITNMADASINPIGIVCAELGPVTLNAVDPGGTWSGLGIIDSLAGIFDPSITGAGSHPVTYTITGNCGDTSDINIIVNELTLTFSQTLTTCTDSCDGKATVAVSGGTPTYMYNWTSGGNLATDSNLCGNISQTVTVTDLSGCTATDSITIGTPNPLSVFAGDDTTICVDGAAVFRAFGTGGTPSITGPGDGYSYEWNNGLGSGSNQTITPTIDTSYIVTIRDSNDCVATDSVTVLINDPLNLTLTEDTSICFGDNVNLIAIASGGNGGPYSYTWNNGLNSNNQQQVTPQSTTNYIVIADDGCSPTIQDSVNIIVNNLPVVDFVIDSAAQCELPTPVFTFISVSDPTNAPPELLSWDFGDGSPPEFGDTVSHSYALVGQYDVLLTVTSAAVDGGCTNDNTRIATVMENPIAIFEITPNTITTVDPIVNFEDLSESQTGISTWEWQFGELGTSNEQNPTFNFPEEPNCYEILLKVTDLFGCIDTTSRKIIIEEEETVFVPNTFSPNNDGINDTFKPEVFVIGSTAYQFSVLNRWGEKLFDTDQIEESWDGTFNGELVQNGVYIYKISYKDKNGKETVLRGKLNVLN